MGQCPLRGRPKTSGHESQSNLHQKAKMQNKNLIDQAINGRNEKLLFNDFRSSMLESQTQLRSLHAKRRLMKAIKMVYLVNMFVSIAKQNQLLEQVTKLKSDKERMAHMPIKEDRLKQFWDIFMLIVLIYSSLYIPYVAAFEDDVEVYEKSKFTLSAIFVIDIILLMRMCYYDKHNQLVQDQFTIFINYCTGWFMIDLISAIPYSECQLVKILRICRVQTIISSSSLNQNKILEFIIDLVDLKQAYLIQVLFFSFIGFHYAACLWALSIVYSGGEQPQYIDGAQQLCKLCRDDDILPTMCFRMINIKNWNVIRWYVYEYSYWKFRQYLVGY